MAEPVGIQGVARKRDEMPKSLFDSESKTMSLATEHCLETKLSCYFREMVLCQFIKETLVPTDSIVQVSKIFKNRKRGEIVNISFSFSKSDIEQL